MGAAIWPDYQQVYLSSAIGLNTGTCPESQDWPTSKILVLSAVPGDTMRNNYFVSCTLLRFVATIQASMNRPIAYKLIITDTVRCIAALQEKKHCNVCGCGG